MPPDDRDRLPLEDRDRFPLEDRDRLPLDAPDRLPLDAPDRLPLDDPRLPLVLRLDCVRLLLDAVRGRELALDPLPLEPLRWFEELLFCLD